MNKIEAIIRPEALDVVKSALAEQGFAGLNAVNVMGRGVQKGIAYAGRSGQVQKVEMLHKTKLEVVVKDADTSRAIDTIVSAARAGNIREGKIFVTHISDVISMRTGERGEIAV